MKFKKVEIQAFRAYDKVENGTFDFVISEKNELADFVSIYAPNGFGKTSFYDAVEWGFTNNINRFLRRPVKNADSAKAERTYKADYGNKGKQHIIRNKYSSPELEGYVKLTTTTSKIPIINKIPDVRSGQPDFKFKSSDTKKGTEFFQDILLSQEWIDAFLKEDDAALRYEKFIVYFGDKNLDEYYKTIISLIKANESTMADLRVKLQECQLKLAFDGDRDILVKINSHIKLVNEDKIVFNSIDSSFTDKDFIELSNMIAERKLYAEALITNLTEKSKSTEQMMIGTTDSPGMEEYIDAVSKLELGLEALSNLKQLVASVEKRKLSQNELKSLNADLLMYAESLTEVKGIKALFPDYLIQESAQKNIDDKLKLEISNLTNKLNELSSRKTDLQQAENRLASIFQEIEKIRKEIVDVAYEDALIADLIAQQNLNKNEFQEIVKSIENETNLVKKLEQDKFDHEQALLFLESHQFTLLSDDLKSPFSTSFVDVQRLIVNKQQTQSEIDTIQISIENQESLNEELQQFVIKGSEIINKSQSSHCPLCDSDFKSFQELAAAISGNSALSKAIQTLVEQKANKTASIKEIEDRISNLLKPIEDNIRSSISNISVKIDIENETLIGLKLKHKTVLDKTQELDQKVVDWSTRLNGLIPEHFNSVQEEAITLLEQELSKTQNSIANLNEQIAAQEKIISQFRGAVASQEELLKQAKENQNFQVVEAFFKKNYAAKDISIKYLDDNIKKLEADISKAEKLNVNLTEAIKSIDEITKSVLVEELNKDLINREMLNSELLRAINRFEQLAQSVLEIQLERNITLPRLQELLKTNSEKLLKEIERNKVYIQNLSLLELLKENVLPFLTHQKVAQTADDLTARIKILKDKVNKALTTERDRISKFIHEQVESFFYEDLINVLYRKIDPHPEYKKIKFQCDFSYEKPRLNVFVTGENGDNPLVPNLYFSTAQMNILSLSIFLAKALNASNNGKSVDCIFIDDPIQSMDSINILSTIDLFRSIVIKFKKQIILSTHDENFHNLLRKKIPENLFNAKYIELETFGTVKQAK